MSKALPFALYRDLLGKPFAFDGRGPDCFDCVGLAMEIQRRRGMVLPAYLSCPEELHRQVAAGGVLHETHRIAAPEPGCLVLMRGTRPDERHVGVMVDELRMLHASEAVWSVVVESLSRSFWGRRVRGYYRIEVPV